MAAPNLLPLFPLGSVLFPGVPIQLHIFEERYKEMMRRCLGQADQEFGVVLIEEGREALGPIARTHSHGTCAQILKVQPLPEGRMNLVAIGTRRFRIMDLDRDGAAYLQGQVEYEDESEGTEPENREAAGLLPLIQEYVELVSSSDPEDAANRMDYSKLPRDARALSYAASYLLHVPQHQKQQLLELRTLPDLMAGVRDMYRKQIELLKIVQERGLEPPESAGGLSLN
ncbi:MAG: LON peptidase substrate-binding domain-containing protein [bacterium]|nr:LON peptidase substrate-binding domain-containing protein [bacterium]